MKVEEIRQQSTEDLNKELTALKEQLFKLRFHSVIRSTIRSEKYARKKL